KRAREREAAENKRVRDAAIEAARKAQRQQADPLKTVWDKAKEYLAKGVENFDDLRNKVAADLGWTVERVTSALAQKKNTKRAIDELWLKQQKVRALDMAAKRWVKEIDIPWWRKKLSQIPRALFNIRVGFHGTVALGTHAPLAPFTKPLWGPQSIW